MPEEFRAHFSSVEQKQNLFDGKLGSISNKRFVIIRFRQIKAAKIQASLDNISYKENFGLSPMILCLLMFFSIKKSY